jgi:hypothetical protein
MIGTAVFIIVLLVCGCIFFNENDWTRWIK